MLAARRLGRVASIALHVTSAHPGRGEPGVESGLEKSTSTRRYKLRGISPSKLRRFRQQIHLDAGARRLRKQPQTAHGAEPRPGGSATDEKTSGIRGGASCRSRLGSNSLARAPNVIMLVGSIEVKRLVCALAPGILLLPVTVHAARLEPTTSKAWAEYVEAANMRMEQRLNPGNSFLWVDEAPARLQKVRSGEIVVSPVGLQSPMRVRSGLIHDWIGAVFIPHVSINDVLKVARDYARYKELYRPAVIDSKVIATGEVNDRFSMLLLAKSAFLKTAVDADYEASYVRVDNQRVYRVSRTTRVQEIENYGTPSQHMLNPGEGMGLIWRIATITRYVERDGGVYIEFEVMALSRDIPSSFRWLIEPLVTRASRRSLWVSLRQTRNAMSQGIESNARRAMRLP